MREDFHFVFGGPVSDDFPLSIIHLKMSLESEKPPPEEKESLNLKKPCKVPLLKLQKSRVFQFHLLLTNVFGVDLSRPPAGKNIFKFMVVSSNR